jgi:hypothetical protein
VAMAEVTWQHSNRLTGQMEDPIRGGQVARSQQVVWCHMAPIGWTLGSLAKLLLEWTGIEPVTSPPK